jgi:hypothetical protein
MAFKRIIHINGGHYIRMFFPIMSNGKTLKPNPFHHIPNKIPFYPIMSFIKVIFRKSALCLVYTFPCHYYIVCNEYSFQESCIFCWMILATTCLILFAKNGNYFFSWMCYDFSIFIFFLSHVHKHSFNLPWFTIITLNI